MVLPFFFHLAHLLLTEKRKEKRQIAEKRNRFSIYIYKTSFIEIKFDPVAESWLLSVVGRVPRERGIESTEVISFFPITETILRESKRIRVCEWRFRGKISPLLAPLSIASHAKFYTTLNFITSHIYPLSPPFLSFNHSLQYRNKLIYNPAYLAPQPPPGGDEINYGPSAVASGPNFEGKFKHPIVLISLCFYCPPPFFFFFLLSVI